MDATRCSFHDDEYITCAACKAQGIPAKDIAFKQLTSTTVADAHLMLQMDPSLLKLYDDSGQGPLHAAVFAKRSDIAQLLLDHGVPVDSKDFAENAPLHLAALHHCDAVIVSCSMRVLP